MQAAQLDARTVVYPSNLSAALFEVGDYARCADAVLRAWNLVRGQPNRKPELVSRLSARLAKALRHGVYVGTVSQGSVQLLEDDIVSLRDASAVAASVERIGTSSEEAVSRGWEEWDNTLPVLVDLASKRELGLKTFSRIPIYYQPL